MTRTSDHHAIPQDVSFFVGPPGNSVEKRTYRLAVKLSNRGDRTALNEYLEDRKRVLYRIVWDPAQGMSALRISLSALLGQDVGAISTFVGAGMIKGEHVPVLTIYLDRTKTIDGAPIADLLLKTDADAIAAMLGLAFEADWIFTSWTYPLEPADVEESDPIAIETRH